jgi:rod shape-determining protein MreD
VAFLLTVLLAFASLALQATLVPHLAIAGIRPDLPLVVAVGLALWRGPLAGTLAGFFVGLAQDLTNPAFLGLNALAKSLLGYAVGSLRAHFDAHSLPAHAALLAVAVLVHDLVYLTVFTRLALSELFLGLGLRSVPTAVYTAVVGSWALAALGSTTRRSRLGRPSFARR